MSVTDWRIVAVVLFATAIVVEARRALRRRRARQKAGLARAAGRARR